MKKLIFILLLLTLNLNVYADKIGEPLEVDTVIAVPNASADQIYQGMKNWLATYMVDSRKVIHLDDPTNKHLIGKAAIPMEVNHFVYSGLTGYIHYTMDVQARDGRMRIKLNNFYHKASKQTGPYNWDMGAIYINGERPDAPQKSYKEMQKRAIPLINQTASKIITGMKYSASTTSSANDDW